MSKPKTHSDLQNVLKEGDTVDIEDNIDVDSDIRGKRYTFKGYVNCEYINTSEDECSGCEGRAILRNKHYPSHIKCLCYGNIQPVTITESIEMDFLSQEEMTI